MCKLFVLTNIAHLKPRLLGKLLKASAKTMGKTDSDGFGWSMLNGNKFVGERCLDPEYFENRFFNNGTIPEDFKTIFETWEANAFGAMPAVYSGGLLIHARISTNQISLKNTHPLINSTWSLIHNGIIENMGDKYEMKTSNDSEHALHYLSEQGIQGMVGNIAGYYAVGALNKLTGELVIVRDATANLNACYIPSLASMAFGTNADQLHSILKEVGLVHTKIKGIKDNVALTFSREGLLTKQEKITPRKESYYSAAAFASSFGSEDWRNKYMEDGDYPSDWRSILPTTGHVPSRNNPMIVDNNLKVVQDATKDVPDDIKRIRTYDDKGLATDEMVYDLLDEDGNPVPKHRLDSVFYFVDYNSNEMSAQDYLDLESDEKEYCEVYDKKSGNLIGKIAS